jgi:predicted ATPase
MLLRHVRLQNLLSFKDTTVELRGLNVLIGPNAVGKSNLLEAISLLQAAPSDLNAAVMRQGGVRVLCSLAGPEVSPIAAIECSYINGELLQYRLEFSEQADGFIVVSERLNSIVEGPHKNNTERYFERTAGSVSLILDSINAIPQTQSVLSLYKNPADPTPITRVGRLFERIRIYREFRTTGLLASARSGVSVSARKDFLDDGGDNLAVVLLDLDFQGALDRVQSYLHRFCDRFKDVKVRLDGQIAKAYIQEQGLLQPLVSTRLSDGTLKFLCLMAVLLEPKIGPLICIEEPEVGLHPEAIQIVAEALVDASERTQLVVTTHSDALIDALSDQPENVLVTERDFDNGTQFRRLDARQLSVWLERYTLGALWRKGEIGGNRW